MSLLKLFKKKSNRFNNGDYLQNHDDVFNMSKNWWTENAYITDEEKKARLLKQQQNQIQNQTSQQNQNENEKSLDVTKLGFIGEKVFNYNLLHSEILWNKISSHCLEDNIKVDLISSRATFKWMNEDKESYAPFDFIINGDYKFINWKWTLTPINPNLPIILIDVKTTSRAKSRFVRSNIENEKINKLLNEYRYKYNCIYMIALILIQNPYEANFNTSNLWSIRLINDFKLRTYMKGLTLDKQGIDYNYSL